MLRYRLGMRSWPRSVVVLRIRAGGPPFVVYRMERAGRPEPELIGYWTSRPVPRARASASRSGRCGRPCRGPRRCRFPATSSTHQGTGIRDLND